MKLAIMQPYFFPYVGYFQLLAAVDKFVMYDDVSFIVRGWVNRNRILVNGQSHLFTVPLSRASHHSRICDIELHPVEYPHWKRKFVRTIEHAYKRAPQFDRTYELLLEVLDSDARTIGELARYSVVMVSKRLDLTTQIEPTSAVYRNAHFHGQHRILDICVREQAAVYINTPGGRDLYNPVEFMIRGIELRFLQSQQRAYTQLDHDFVPSLSILDVLMFNELSIARQMVNSLGLEALVPVTSQSGFNEDG